MDSNNKSKPPSTTPRTLRPKTVFVSPIKSPVGSGMLQAVGPFMPSQGTGQYMIGGNVPHIYPANAVSQALPLAQLQPRMSIQPLFTQTQQMPYQLGNTHALAQTGLLRMPVNQSNEGQFPGTQTNYPVIVSAAPFYPRLPVPTNQKIALPAGVQSQIPLGSQSIMPLGFPPNIAPQFTAGNQIAQNTSQIGTGYQNSSQQIGFHPENTGSNNFLFQSNVSLGILTSVNPVTSILPSSLNLTSNPEGNRNLLQSTITPSVPVSVNNLSAESESDISIIELSVTDSPATSNQGILSDIALCQGEDSEQPSETEINEEQENDTAYTEMSVDDGSIDHVLRPIPQEVIPLGNQLLMTEDLLVQEPNLEDKLVEADGEELDNFTSTDDSSRGLSEKFIVNEVEKEQTKAIEKINSSPPENLLASDNSESMHTDFGPIVCDGSQITSFHERLKVPLPESQFLEENSTEAGCEMETGDTQASSHTSEEELNKEHIAVNHPETDRNLETVTNQHSEFEDSHNSASDGDSQSESVFLQSLRTGHPKLSSWRASPIDPSIQRVTDSRGDIGTISDEMNSEDSSSMSWEKFRRHILKLRPKNDSEKSEFAANGSEHIFKMGSVKSEELVRSAADHPSAADNETVKADGTMEHESEDESGEEPEFVWEDYLQQTGTIAVPPGAFKHVEYSLQSGFVRGMKLEVQNKSDPSTFWVASVVMTCGPLLLLRYDGYGEDSSADFWCSLATTELHQIGWSAQNGKNLQPPEELKDKVSDWRAFLLESLTGARTAPAAFFEKNTGSSPVDQLKCGMKLELQDVLNPLHVWLVQILENVGGRLYLRLEGTTSASKHFWMFYLNPRLHPVGWANEHDGCIYHPPQDIYDEQTDECWAEILQTVLKECENDIVPDDVFKDQRELKTHQFTVGLKLEALVPGMNMISPATVCQVINDKYFMVEIDDLRPSEERERIQVCCNSEYLGIFPVSWCQYKGIRLTPPQGLSGGEFVWGEYLSFCNAKAAPEKLFNSGTDDHNFERGMKLEAVNPDNPNQICAATITKIVGPLLWIHLEHMRDIPSHIEDIDSHNLFPVGWCESNHCQLKPPLKARVRQKQMSECRTEEVYRSLIPGQGAWCPKIYFNHRCFSGPYLSKGRMPDLPMFVGPGPMDLVLREVLSLLIGIAYVPCRALKEIQHEGHYNPFMKPHTLKAKYKGKKYKGIVEVCQNENHLEDFCRNICIKLECCPYLFSTLKVKVSCPENCQQLTKTKSHTTYGKKRKFGSFVNVKPPLFVQGSGEPKKRGRKRKGFLLHHRKGQSRRNHDNHLDLQKDEGFIDDDEEEEMLHTDRKSYDIQTRGAKLPKYSFEKKSHRKIFMAQTERQSLHEKHGFKRLPGTWSLSDSPQRALKPREGSLKLETNPLHWSVGDVVQFLKTTDCSHLARIIKDQEIDGQAFLLLSLSTIQDHLELKLGPAVKLCHHIERVKLAFYESYA